MILCQISDLHIKPERKLAYGVVDTATMLGAALRTLAGYHSDPMRCSPPAIWSTAPPAEYALLRELLSPLTMPFYLMPGNHDDRRNLREVFDDHPLFTVGIRVYSVRN